jgi:putative ABC transport system substrate-binding protein
MARKPIIILLVGLIIASIHPAEAQQAKKVPRIGFLSFVGRPNSPTPSIEAFRLGLRDLGYAEGQNIVIEYRYAEGKRDRLPDLATELVRLKVEVTVAGDSATIPFAAQATRSIPIVMTVSNDPVGTGLIASLARPGGNITGLSNVSVDLAGKRLELLKEIVAKLSRVAVLGPPGNPDWTELVNAAATMGIKLQTLKVRDSKEFEGAFELARRERAAGLIVLPSPVTNSYRKQIVALAAKSRLPAMYPLKEYVEAGGLIAYGPNIPEMHRRAAVYVDKILKGAKPADLPVEQPMKFEFIINLKTAKQIGLTIPPNVLARADKVIR